MLASTRVLFVCLVFIPAVTVAEVSPSVVIHAATNAVYNGSSENANKPYIAINAELQLNRNWVLGSQLQDAEPRGIRQRQRVLATYIGYDYQLHDNWLSSVYVINRQFLGAARNWDYNEFSFQMSHKKGLSLNLNYSPNYYASSVKGIGSSLNYIHSLSDSYYAKTQVGNFNVPSLFSYQFAHIAIGTSFGRFNIEAAYHWNSTTKTQTSIGPISSPQFVVGINYLAF